MWYIFFEELEVKVKKKMREVRGEKKERGGGMWVGGGGGGGGWENLVKWMSRV